MRHIHGFALALALLTRIPLPNAVMPKGITPAIKNLSVLYYPMAGAVIAAILIGSIKLLVYNEVPVLFTATVVVCLWVILTGALHLDGLADSIDAWAASHKSNITSDLILRIFKDPESGPFAVVAIVLTLLLKVTAIAALIDSGKINALLFALVLARLVAIFYMVTTQYVSQYGMAQDITLNLKNKPLYFQSVLILFSGLYFFEVVLVLVIIFFIGLIGYFWRRLWLHRVRGYVGDCVGALIEFVETAVLFLFVIY